MKTEEEIRKALNEYADTVRRICFLHLKDFDDTEDIFQNVFIKYAQRKEPFESKKHEKAWIIKVAVNQCKDVLKSFYKRNITLTDALPETYSVSNDNETGQVLETVLSLPEKYKTCIYLYYFEGYKAGEIAEITGRTVSGVHKVLSRGRKLLKEKLGGDVLE